MNFIDIYPAKGFFTPGSQIKLLAEINSDLSDKGSLQFKVHFLNKIILEKSFEIEFNDKNLIDIAFEVPELSPRGYGVEATLIDNAGNIVGTKSTAFDVLESWVDFPRYGFVSDFQVDREDPLETMNSLVRYHINGLQFYDWQFRHDQLIPPTDVFVDPLDRKLSLNVVKEIIEAAHDYGMAAMPYLAVYAASIYFWKENKSWGLFDKDGKPHMFEDFLGLMNPSKGSPWIQHLLSQCEKVVENLPFDGLHVDQYGEPKDGFDSTGNPVNIPKAFGDFIQLLKNQFPKETVVFNAVGNWPIEELASSNQDFVYIEIWPPTPYFRDLHEIVSNARKISQGKPTVIALYIPADQFNNVILANAIIMASGGTRIDLGENNRLLTDPYFPKHQEISPKLGEMMRSYYDFVVRYENIIGPNVIEISDIEIVLPENIFSISREANTGLAVNLINFSGMNEPKWTENQSIPASIKNFTIKIESKNKIDNVHISSPDRENLNLEKCNWNQNEGVIEIQIPFLDYWTMVYLEYGNSEN